METDLDSTEITENYAVHKACNLNITQASTCKPKCSISNTFENMV